MVENMRAEIESLGGEIRFGSRVEEVEIDLGQVRAVLLADGTRIAASHVVLAVGHSARDTFRMLQRAACISRPSRSRSASASNTRSP
jgi:uncharacterized FAD-dependent dehydrogenase